MKLQIRNMVCDRCKMVVQNEIAKRGWALQSVSLGQVEIVQTLSGSELSDFDESLRGFGFELIHDTKSRTVEKIKNLIIGIVRDSDKKLETNLSDYLSSHLHQDYSALSNLFSAQTQTTIEQFHIAQRIERVKELLEYGELNLNQIADALHYSSASHLTRQFRKVTGLTPSAFRQSQPGRIALNRL